MYRPGVWRCPRDHVKIEGARLRASVSPCLRAQKVARKTLVDHVVRQIIERHIKSNAACRGDDWRMDEEKVFSILSKPGG